MIGMTTYSMNLKWYLRSLFSLLTFHKLTFAGEFTVKIKYNGLIHTWSSIINFWLFYSLF